MIVHFMFNDCDRFRAELQGLDCAKQPCTCDIFRYKFFWVILGDKLAYALAITSIPLLQLINLCCLSSDISITLIMPQLPISALFLIPKLKVFSP
jgi:hypothetical protein